MRLYRSRFLEFERTDFSNSQTWPLFPRKHQHQSKNFFREVIKLFKISSEIVIMRIVATNKRYNKKYTQIWRKLRSYVEILSFMLSPQVFPSLLLCINCFYKHSTVLFHTITSCCRDFSKYADFFLHNLVKFICGIRYSKRNINRVAIVYLTCTMLFESMKKAESQPFETIRTLFDTLRLIFDSARVAELRTLFFEP